MCLAGKDVSNDNALQAAGDNFLTSTLSTSMPMEVMASATWSGVRSHFRYSLSQLYDSFILLYIF